MTALLHCIITGIENERLTNLLTNWKNELEKTKMVFKENSLYIRTVDLKDMIETKRSIFGCVDEWIYTGKYNRTSTTLAIVPCYATSMYGEDRHCCPTLCGWFDLNECFDGEFQCGVPVLIKEDRQNAIEKINPLVGMDKYPKSKIVDKSIIKPSKKIPARFTEYNRKDYTEIWCFTNKTNTAKQRACARIYNKEYLGIDLY
tara:strand:+ start:50 stop:655 length:606 start_codon:yes stop_codon:yes gene_type:complete